MEERRFDRGRQNSESADRSPAAGKPFPVLSNYGILSKTRRMQQVTASHVKQNFGEVLARATTEPLAVMRHRRMVAAIVPVSWLERHGAIDERRAARAAQREVEQQRLLAHQALGIELLCAPPDRQRRMLEAARGEIKRWERAALCSRDYIDRWREWLRLPVRQLVRSMCSDAHGWGPAMRQNSPFIGAGLVPPP